MQTVAGKQFKTIAQIRLQDAYDSLSDPQTTIKQDRRRHSLYASQDRYVQREHSHKTQFSASCYELYPGDLPRDSDSVRRTKFMGGCLISDRDSTPIPDSERREEYLAPNYRETSSAMPMFQSTKGLKVEPYQNTNQKSLKGRKTSKRPNSAQIAAAKTPKGPIGDLTTHPNFANFREAGSFDYVSSYMSMKPGAHRLQKNRGRTEPLNTTLGSKEALSIPW